MDPIAAAQISATDTALGRAQKINANIAAAVTAYNALAVRFGATVAGPTASFSVTVSGLVVTVDATGSTSAAGTITGYSVDWGDSTVTSKARDSHTYAAAGTYRVAVTVTDSTGRTDVKTHTAIATAPTTPVDSFSLKVTEPTTSNTGVGLAALGYSTPTALYTGSMTPTGTQTIENVIIRGNFKPGSGAVITLNNCLIEELVTSNGTWSLQGGPGKVIANYCDITTLAYDHNAQGAFANGGSSSAPMLQLYRCHIYEVGDGVDIQGTAWVRGCLIERLLYITPDSNHSDNKTHCDGIQMLSGDGIQIIGNAIHSMASTTHSTPSLIASHPQALSCLMLTPNSGPITNLLVDSNWFYGGEIAINGGGLDRASGNTGQIVNNRFDRNQYYPGHTIDLDSTATGITCTGNVYMDDGSAVTVRRNA